MMNRCGRKQKKSADIGQNELQENLRRVYRQAARSIFFVGRFTHTVLQERLKNTLGAFSRFEVYHWDGACGGLKKKQDIPGQNKKRVVDNRAFF